VTEFTSKRIMLFPWQIEKCSNTNGFDSLVGFEMAIYHQIALWSVSECIQCVCVFAGCSFLNLTSQWVV